MLPASVLDSPQAQVHRKRLPRLMSPLVRKKSQFHETTTPIWWKGNQVDVFTMGNHIPKLVKKFRGTANSLKFDKSVINLFIMGDQISRGEELGRKLRRNSMDPGKGFLLTPRKVATSYKAPIRYREGYHSQITYHDKATQTETQEEDTIEKILKVITTLCTKVDSMDNEIQKLKTNEDNLKSKASISQQHDYKNAELCRSKDRKNPELKGDRVGAVYVKLSSCHLKLDHKHEATRAYDITVDYYKMTKNLKEAISCLEKATHLFLDIGRLNATRGHYQCRQKIPEYSAKVGKYQRSITMFEEIATYSIRNNLLKYGVRGYLLNAGICQLCRGDVVAINNALERYQGLAAAIDKRDIAEFTSCLKEYDSITKLDEWRTLVLLKVKEALKVKELE
ncbi:hypothetical protein MTR67_023339 [Solanum verrucosum]|uniref:Uncharacterized protein n=1 Tax=Solanum verrucosum TaxID=315347 RepID=A0AAF0QTA1_SOLVR|nr:hypothetical protein MTR67_023339 [Solanum verrucosum]